MIGIKEKGVSGMGFVHADMPFTKEGIIPGIIMNPHAIPSRMTIGMLTEGLEAKLGSIIGAFGDATIFRKVDIRATGDELEKYGYDRYGVERMYCGFTGEPIDVEIFISPIYYQRLQKFAVEEKYSVSVGPKVGPKLISNDWLVFLKSN